MGLDNSGNIEGIPKPLFFPRAAASPQPPARRPRAVRRDTMRAPRRRGGSKPPWSRPSDLKASRWSLERGLQWTRERGDRHRQPEGGAAVRGGWGSQRRSVGARSAGQRTAAGAPRPWSMVRAGAIPCKCDLRCGRNRRRVHRQLQVPQHFLDDVDLGNRRNDPQPALRTHRAACHVHGEDALEQPCPRPVRRRAPVVGRFQPLLAWGGDDGRPQVAMRCQATAVPPLMQTGQGDQCRELLQQLQHPYCDIPSQRLFSCLCRRGAGRL
jgi:hypothetical protein